MFPMYIFCFQSISMFPIDNVSNRCFSSTYCPSNGQNCKEITWDRNSTSGYIFYFLNRFAILANNETMIFLCCLNCCAEWLKSEWFSFFQKCLLSSFDGGFFTTDCNNIRLAIRWKLNPGIFPLEFFDTLALKISLVILGCHEKARVTLLKLFTL